MSFVCELQQAAVCTYVNASQSCEAFEFTTCLYFFTLKIRTQCYRSSPYQSNRIQFASLVVSVGNYQPPLGSAGLKSDACARICLAIPPPPKFSDCRSFSPRTE